MNLSTLKAAIPLQAFAIEHLKLKPYGKDLLGLCPFHEEKTPSFRVHPEYFYCHGCHFHGDVIDLYAHIHGITKGRAIHALAREYGVTLQPQTKARRAYDRQEDAFVDWWWRRTKDRLAVRVSAYARYGSEEDAEAAGLLWRQVAGLDKEGRRAMALRCAGVEDRRAWEEVKAETMKIVEAVLA